MKQVELKPIKETPEDFDEMEVRIIEFFKDEIYLPLLKELGLTKQTLQNSFDDFLNAIRTGKIWFYRGQFKGRFNSMVTKELKRLGAKWDRRQGVFKIPYSELSPGVKSAIEASEARFQQTAFRIDKKLSEMVPEAIADKLKLEDLFDSTMYKTQKKIKDTLKGITVAPDLSDDARKRIAKEYTNNMRLYIKDWTETEIKKLRATVQQKIYAGSRYENMVKTIQRSYDVSQSKAKFLARQETSILMAKFKESRYKDVGSVKYKWKCVIGSPNHPVRPLHKLQDGKVFAWDNPPIVTSKGDRKNPGMDYGCRCTAIPIIHF